MRDYDAPESAREEEEIDPDLESPKEDSDWDEETMLSSLINEDMVKDIASRLARANVGESGGDEAPGEETAVEQEAGAGRKTAESEDPVVHKKGTADRACEADRGHDSKTLDGIIDALLEDGAREAEAEAVEFAESRLAAGQDLRVLERYGPPMLGVGLVNLAMTLSVAYAVGLIVQEQSVYFFPPVAWAMALTVLLGSFNYLLCRSWFKRAWEQRSQILDAAAATVLDLESNPRSRSDHTRGVFEKTMEEMYSRVRAEMEERSEKLRKDTHRDVQKIRIFFEALLEKHVKRISEDLRAKKSELEKLQMQQRDGEKTDAELVRLTRDNERLRAQLEELEVELGRHLSEDELEELRLKRQVATDEQHAGRGEEEQDATDERRVAREEKEEAYLESTSERSG